MLRTVACTLTIMMGASCKTTTMESNAHPAARVVAEQLPPLGPIGYAPPVEREEA